MSRPATPPSADYAGYAEQAKKTVDKALESQKTLAKDMRGRSEEMRLLGERSQKELSKLYGLTGEQAIDLYERRFDQSIPQVARTYAAALKNFDPALLSSPSAGRFSDFIRGAADEYRQALRGEGELGSQRLYKAIEAPKTSFGSVATDPAFNVLQDRTFMETAQMPPTIRSDVESMKSLYQYAPAAKFREFTYNI